MDSKMFHQRARDCLRLADECPDLYAREALMELADEFKHTATQLDSDARTRARSGRQRRAREDAGAHRHPSPR
jgi:hypothetical protein